MTLKERRDAFGMTQCEVALDAGITQAAISAYENGKWKPKYYAALRLADLYGCSIDEIMEGCGPGEANDAGRAEESL